VKRLFLSVLALFAFVILPAAQADAQRGRSEGRRGDGPRQVNELQQAEYTPENGIRIGSPNARVQIVAYMSLACPECADVIGRGGERLFQDYVRRGVVSVEYRPFVVNGFDLAAALISRCASPRRYFHLTHSILGAQPRWMGRMQSLSEAQRTELRSLPQLQAMQRIAQWTELDEIATRNGLDSGRLHACLADQAGLDRINALQQVAVEAGITSAPTFFVNGERTEARDWPALDRLIRAAQ